MSQEHMMKPGRGPGGVLRAAALGALWCFFAAAASAQSGHCDPQVRVSGSSPLGYSARGTPSENTDRCEGTYSLQVSSQALQIASFTRSFEAYEPSEVEALHVEWEAPYPRPVHLRAVGLRPQLHYQMDTVRPPGSTSFRWPGDVLGAYQIAREDVGLLGWTSAPVGGSARDALVPLRVSPDGAPPETETYTVVLMPTRELDEVYLSVASVDEAGEAEAYVEFQTPLGYGYYPAHQLIEIDIPARALSDGALYYVEIGARYAQGGATSTHFFFHHVE